MTEIELLSALKKKQQMGDLSKKDGDRTWQLFKKHRSSGLYEIAKMGPGVFKSAEWLLEMTSNSLRTLDAIHLGVAHNYGIELYTFDQTMMEAAKEFNIGTVNKC